MNNENYLPVVIKAEYVQEYILRITFDNGTQKTVDCSQWLKGGIFKPLEDVSYFQLFYVDGWTVAWPNGADIAPETLYAA